MRRKSQANFSAELRSSSVAEGLTGVSSATLGFVSTSLRKSTVHGQRPSRFIVGAIRLAGTAKLRFSPALLALDATPSTMPSSSMTGEPDEPRLLGAVIWILYWYS